MKNIKKILCAIVISAMIATCILPLVGKTAVASAEGDEIVISEKTSDVIDFFEEVFDDGDLEDFLTSWLADDKTYDFYLVDTSQFLTVQDPERMTKDYAFLSVELMRYALDYERERFAALLAEGERIEYHDLNDEILCFLDHIVPLKEYFYDMLGCIENDDYEDAPGYLKTFFDGLKTAIDDTFTIEDPDTPYHAQEFYAAFHDEMIAQSEAIATDGDVSYNKYALYQGYLKGLAGVLNADEEEVEDYFDEFLTDGSVIPGDIITVLTRQLIDVLEEGELIDKETCLDTLYADFANGFPEEAVWIGLSTDEKFDLMKLLWEDSLCPFEPGILILAAMDEEDSCEFIDKAITFTFAKMFAEFDGYLQRSEWDFTLVKKIFEKFMPLCYNISDVFEYYKDDSYSTCFGTIADVFDQFYNFCNEVFVDDRLYDYDLLSFSKQYAVTQIYRECSDLLDDDGQFSDEVMAKIEKANDDVRKQNTLEKVKTAKTDGVAYVHHFHEIDETVDSLDATCTTAGHDAYYSCECGLYFEDEEFKTEIGNATALATWLAEGGDGYIAPLGHLFNGTTDYEWDGNECTASRDCTRDGCTVSKTETVCAKYVKDFDATCEDDENGHYVATFATAGFDVQATEESSVIIGGTALGHVAGTTPEYTWNGNKCTAKLPCTRTGCDGAAISETVNAIFVKDTEGTCVSTEKGHYLAVFDNPLFSRQTTAENSVDKGTTSDHDFNAPTYVWNGKTCTAIRVCRFDETHVETETVTAFYVKDTNATETSNEKGHYYASFENSAFSDQATETDDVEIPDSKLPELKTPNTALIIIVSAIVAAALGFGACLLLMKRKK